MSLVEEGKYGSINCRNTNPTIFGDAGSFGICSHPISKTGISRGSTGYDLTTGSKLVSATVASRGEFLTLYAPNGNNIPVEPWIIFIDAGGTNIMLAQIDYVLDNDHLMIKSPSTLNITGVEAYRITTRGVPTVEEITISAADASVPTVAVIYSECNVLDRTIADDSIVIQNSGGCNPIFSFGQTSTIITCKS